MRVCRRWSQQQAEFALENGGVLVVDDSHVGTGASVVLGRWGCCESLNPAGLPLPPIAAGDPRVPAPTQPLLPPSPFTFLPEPGCMLMPRHSSGVAKCSACGKLFDVEANAYAERNRLPPNCQRHRKEMQLDCAFSDGGLWPCCGTRGLSSTKVCVPGDGAAGARVPLLLTPLPFPGALAWAAMHEHSTSGFDSTSSACSGARPTRHVRPVRPPTA